MLLASSGQRLGMELPARCTQAAFEGRVQGKEASAGTAFPGQKEKDPPAHHVSPIPTRVQGQDT